jgi:hypothetical protein
MYRQLATMAYALYFAVVKTATALANAWWTALGDPADKYRPEAHYKRGRGPKWRARHQPPA